MRPTSTSRRSPRTSTSTSPSGTSSRCSTRCEYLRHETDVWFEITNLVIPGHNDSDGEFDEMAAWIAEHLGPDVPLHFTAFHPDFKMLDVPPTPAGDAHPGAGDRPAQRAAVRLHGQRSRHRRVEHVLPRLWADVDRARLVRARRLPPDRRRALRALRHADPRTVRGDTGELGCRGAQPVWLDAGAPVAFRSRRAVP